jgi:hypothetical protein
VDFKTTARACGAIRAIVALVGLAAAPVLVADDLQGAGRLLCAAAQHSAQSQVQQQSAVQQQNFEQNMLNFKKAFSVCMEAKEYLVKF